MKKTLTGNIKLNLFIYLLFTIQACADDLLLFSIQKCGTHLLAKAIELISKKKLAGEIKVDKIINFRIKKVKKNCFFRSHLPYLKPVADELIKNKYKGFFIYRDPRDQIVSRAYWIQKRQLYKQSISDLIDSLIPSVKNYYYSFLPWTKDDRFCTVKFEDLVGKLGGGDNNLQKIQFRKICKYLNIRPTPELINYCVQNIYGGTDTFREGKIGSWKLHFNLDQIKKFKDVAGDLLIELGYEKNLNW